MMDGHGMAGNLSFGTELTTGEISKANKTLKSQSDIFLNQVSPIVGGLIVK